MDSQVHVGRNWNSYHYPVSEAATPSDMSREEIDALVALFVMLATWEDQERWDSHGNKN